MAERLKLQKPRVTLSRRFGLGWAARNEMGKVAYRTTREAALKWVFQDWDWCDACNDYTPHHPRNEVCRVCGARRFDPDSKAFYTETQLTIAHALAQARGYRDWFDLRDVEGRELADAYIEDAKAVIDLLPHLLPLDVREALYGDPEANDA